MSSDLVGDMSCWKMHELAIALDKAGFTADLVQSVVNSKGNELAQKMYAALVGNSRLSDKSDVSVASPKFALLVDLGILTVPDDYVHGKQLTAFAKQNRKNLLYYNDVITDKNFQNPTRVLKPGDKLRVRAFKQVVGGITTSEERMAFLVTQKAIHAGAQGASLVFEKMRDQLPKGKWYASFDEKERLWEGPGGYRGVSSMRARSDGDFEFDLGSFENVWRDGNAFFCFCELTSDG